MERRGARLMWSIMVVMMIVVGDPIFARSNNSPLQEPTPLGTGPGVPSCTEECDAGQVCVLEYVDCHLKKPCYPTPVCRDAPDYHPCAAVTCAPGYHCLPFQVYCKMPPCPNFKCVPNTPVEI